MKIDKSMWMLIFGFVLCAGCSPLQSAAENDLFKADADFRKGEVALKNSEPSKALIYLSAAVARYKNAGAFENSTREVSIKYADSLTALGSTEASMGNVRSALEHWREAHRIYELDGRNRSATPVTHSSGCSSGKIITEANRLLFEYPISKVNPLNPIAQIYSDAARKPLPFLLPIADAAVLQVVERRLRKAYPWASEVAIQAKVTKFLRNNGLMRISEAGITDFTLNNFVAPHEVPKFSQASGDSGQLALANIFSIQPFSLLPARQLNEKQTTELHSAFVLDDAIEHNVKLEAFRFLSSRWSESRILDFCGPETRNLGLRIGLSTSKLEFSSDDLLKNSDSKSAGRVNWFVELADVSLRSNPRARPGNYLVTRDDGKWSWVVDFGRCNIFAWSEDDYQIHRIETILLNCLDSQRLANKGRAPFLVLSENDLADPVLDRSIALVNNSEAKVVRKSGRLISYSCRLPEERKLFVSLDQNQQIDSIQLDGKLDTVWQEALSRLRKDR